MSSRKDNPVIGCEKKRMDWEIEKNIIITLYCATCGKNKKECEIYRKDKSNWNEIAIRFRKNGDN